MLTIATKTNICVRVCAHKHSFPLALVTTTVSPGASGKGASKSLGCLSRKYELPACSIKFTLRYSDERGGREWMRLHN